MIDEVSSVMDSVQSEKLLQYYLKWQNDIIGKLAYLDTQVANVYLDHFKDQSQKTLIVTAIDLTVVITSQKDLPNNFLTCADSIW